MMMSPFLNIILAMDESNTIADQGKIPWIPLPTDSHWYLTHSTSTKDPIKRVALILGRVTYEEVSQFDEKYLSKWHFIVITRQSKDSFHSTTDSNYINVVHSFDQAVQQANDLLECSNSQIESVFVFGGVAPYEDALASKLVKRIYLTRVFTKIPNGDTRLSKFDLSDFQRIKRSNEEILSELDDKIIEENGWTYQFQIYELA